ncbi:hypothetical protein SAMN06295974_2735 [Plantibacter flavus]|uniref:Uncharacterized protein n=1 Tax=Plantibacter flavus TaxID=150123 RepID=A0A3N2C546_9MICO|nr:DUF6301 family protein [Plantibacter flavus]ROR82641.1 hypothetical protein EDD42_2733 [Plantibacter flavus]SMG39153.1 hypothetical protein SAMN06295974_2735 [Plantibacter flavus]
MGALARATDAQIDAVCEAFTSVSWPLGRDDFTALAERLGWQLKLETSSGVQHRSGYPVNLPTVRSLVADEAISQVVIAVSDKSDDPGALRSAAYELQSALSVHFGQPAGSQVGDLHWELANGGRIWLKTVPKKVLLVVEDQRFADVERGEERLGIDPGRKPGVGDDTD